MNKNSKRLVAVVVIAVIFVLFFVFLSDKKIKSIGLVALETAEEVALPPPFYRSDNPEKNEKVFQALYKGVVGQKVRVLINNVGTAEFDERFFVLPDEISVLHRAIRKNNKYEDSEITLEEVPKNSPIYLLVREVEEAEVIEIVWLDWSNSNN